MARSSINLTGTAGKQYNLDEIQNSGTRSSSSDALVVQIWHWNPNLPSDNPHSKPNPANPKIGQMWLSKLVAVDSPEYTALLG